MDRLSTFDRPLGWQHAAYVARVTDIRDPDQQGRVKIRLHAFDGLPSQALELWARMVTMFAGNHRGSWFIPDVGDEVLVLFESGDARRPLVVGGLWNGAAAPPETMDGAGSNYRKVLRSRNGVKITFDDQDGQESLKLETPGGQSLTLKDGPGNVAIEDSNGNSIKLESAGITVTAAAKVTVNASTVAVSAGMVTVDAGFSKFSGVVQCDTLIANAVVSASYTPGAGNLW
ncbi:MAG: hypothetical protein NVS9B10_15540 [Nevskia sp.]